MFLLTLVVLAALSITLLAFVPTAYYKSESGSLGATIYLSALSAIFLILVCYELMHEPALPRLTAIIPIALGVRFVVGIWRKCLRVRRTREIK